MDEFRGTSYTGQHETCVPHMRVQSENAVTMCWLFREIRIEYTLRGTFTSQNTRLQALGHFLADKGRGNRQPLGARGVLGTAPI